MGHYFDDHPAVESSPRRVGLALPDLHLRLDTDRGVFGYGLVDSATKLLLLHAPPPPPTGDLLDLGCGSGAIALTMAARAPHAHVWAVDVNARARQLCAANAATNGITNVTVAAPDDVPDGITLALIWSNPPVRIGKSALHGLLGTWLARLDPGAGALLVVSKHLGGDSLQRWLTEAGWPTQRLRSSGDAIVAGIVAAVNRLGAESSPYLRQHCDNPVDWYAWGPEAFDAARRRDVPILLSIGYSSCHWCHVMARESFEDDEVAAAMNAGFVNVKVDREERPDVDAIYMEAVQALTGRGGWPLTAFLTPAGEPFHAGTYFPKAQLLQLLSTVSDVWRTRRPDLAKNVEALRDVLGASARLAPATELPGGEQLDHAVAQLLETFDPTSGGFGQAPKFPSTMNLDLVLRAEVQRPSTQTHAVIATSLDAMASGGMYDHLGGGFARYSVDRHWVVPHFEKMLYDQALLIRTYTHAALALGEARWAQVVAETVDYVLRDLRHPAGGFYSAEDADSPAAAGDAHGHEGLFYTWTPDEVRAVLGEQASAALAWYEMTGPANFTEPGHDGRWIPMRLHHRGEWERSAEIEQARRALFDHRSSRPRPGLDDKVLSEWNGLMLSALAEAAAAFDRADWAAAAVTNGEFLLAELRRPDGRWWRSWHADGDPRARHMALAADHAALIDGFTRLGELTGEARWPGIAAEVADTLLDHFWDTTNGGLFTTPDDGEALIVRQKDITDGATPSANSAAAWALYRLAALSGEARYANQADQILRLVAAPAGKAPAAFGLALAAADLRRRGTTEVVITGDRVDLLRAARSRWLPDGVLAWGERTDSPLWEGRADDGRAYVCQHYACRLPVDTVEDLLAELG